MTELLHFWYSDKQARALAKNWEGEWVALIDGVERRYTSCTPTPEQHSLWDDMTYLGSGRILRCGTVREERWATQ